MDTAIVLQGLNGVLAPVALCATFIFIRYIWLNWSLGYEELRPAYAMLAISAFESLLRTPIFILRTLTNAGYPLRNEVNIWYILGGAGVLIGFLCVIRVFAPMKWGIWSWVIPFILSILTVTASFLFSHWR